MACLSAYVKDPRAKLLDHVIEHCTYVDPAARMDMARLSHELEVWLKGEPSGEPPKTVDLRALAEEIKKLSAPAENENARYWDRMALLRQVVSSTFAYKDSVVDAASNFVRVSANPQWEQWRVEIPSTTGAEIHVTFGGAIRDNTAEIKGEWKLIDVQRQSTKSLLALGPAEIVLGTPSVYVEAASMAASLAEYLPTAMQQLRDYISER